MKISSLDEKTRYKAHILALGLMVGSAALLYLAANYGSNGWIITLLGLFIIGNLLELAI
jgi:hypothetical protein